MREEFFNKLFCLEVWGDYACFTRPEMKVERVSYDVITPSAARGIFEAVFWKPAIKWNVRRIEVLKPIRWISVRRTEVGSVVSDRNRSDGLFIEDDRKQRAGLFLKDVHYRLYAEMEYIPPRQRGNGQKAMRPSSASSIVSRADNSDENPGKYHAIFERRAKKGQCFNTPYLGCREFSCAFSLVENPEEEESAPVRETRDLGYMLYDLDYSDPNDIRPAFFRAELKNGVLHVPSWESEEVRR